MILEAEQPLVEAAVAQVEVVHLETPGQTLAREFFLRPRSEKGWEEDRAELARMVDEAITAERST